MSAESDRALHDRIAEKLDDYLTPAQLTRLFDEILALEKQGRGWCPNCKKQVWVQIPDAKAVTGSLMDLANRAFGTPPKAPEPVKEVAVQEMWTVPDLEALSDEELHRITGTVG